MSRGGAAPAACGGGGSAFQSGLNTFTSCNKAGAILHFNKHLEKYPNDFNALWYRGKSHDILGQTADALKDFEHLQRVSFGAEREAAMALIQKLQGNHTNRRQILTRAVRRYPDSGLLWLEYGSCMSSDNNFSEAKKAFQNVIAVNYPFAFIAHHAIGEIYRNESKRQEAIHHFESAIRGCPTLTISHLALGEMLEEKGETPAASRYYERAKTLNPVLFEGWEKGRRENARYSGRRRGGAGGGRGGGGNGSGSDDDDDRPWEIFDPEAESDPTWNFKYNGEKIYKIGDYCYMRDKAGHAGSRWKAFEYYPSKLVLSHSVDIFGEEIVNKKESNKGLTIWKKDLVGYTRKKKS